MPLFGTGIFALGGIQLDSLFNPFVTGHTPARATGILFNSTLLDINTVFDSVAYGTAGPATGLLSEGVDIATLFAKQGSGIWTLSLPQFPAVITTTPQPKLGTATMSATMAFGPGAPYTYTWTPYNPNGTATFVIVSGQGTASIQYYALGVSGEPGVTGVDLVVSSSGLSVHASTRMTFNVRTNNLGGF